MLPGMTFSIGTGAPPLLAIAGEAEGFYIAWFDVLVILLLLLGFRNGKKHGISEELIGVCQWVIIAGGCALIYEPLGRAIGDFTRLSLFWSHLVAYALGILAVMLFFEWVRRVVGGKLLEADYFGRHEYSLGILGAMTRYMCLVLVVLAFLNSRHYTRAQLIAIQRASAADEVKVSLAPSLSGLQHDVFVASLAGKFVKDHLAMLLIAPTDYDGTLLRKEGTAKKTEKLLDEIMNPPKPKPAATNAPAAAAPGTNVPATNAPPRP